MSISTTETQLGYRHHGRGGPAGLLVTLIVHGVIGYVVYQAQRNSPPPAVQVRDLLVTKMVTIGKPREKFWLPRIVTPPPPAPPPEAVIKVASADAAPAPPPEPTPPPKVAETPPEKPAERPSRTDSRSTSSDLKRALARARALSQATSEDEPPEGSLTGSAMGTSSSAEEGDAYMTQVHDAIHRNWSAPSGLLDEAQLKGLVAELKVSIADSGRLGTPTLTRSSGNTVFDESCVDAVRSTGQVPAVPPAMRGRFRNGVVIEFEGKDLRR